MREILFRGRRIDNGKWVEGFVVICDDRYFILPKTKINCLNPEWLKKGEYAFCCFIEVSPETIVQYTGLTDKNGKKIFEGDFVKVQDDILGSPFCDGITGKIIYDEAAFFIEPKDPTKTQWLFNECAVYEVIGNIHDNPELLEENV